MTERGKAALDELVAAGVCTVEPFNQLDGLVYRPVINCRPFARWLMRNEAAGRFAMVKSDSSSTEEACP